MKTNRPTSVARQVREYLDGHPTLGDALRMGVGNRSAVARRIAEDLGIEEPAAVRAACRRYPTGDRGRFREELMRRVLRKSRIETRTKVAAITVVQDVDVLHRLGDLVEELLDEGALCRLIQVSQGTVIVVDEDAIPRFARKFRESQLIGIHRGLVELAVTSPESIEKTPGLLAFLAGVLSSRGINIVEAMSCYTDTIFLLDHGDLTSAMDTLTKALG